MNQDLSLIEVQFPVSKVSKESYKERKANLGQTLTGLGKWWGRKPLILVRSTILGLLMPASNDPVRDREIFLKILTMDNDGLWLRKAKPVKDITVIENLTLKEVKMYFEIPVDLFSGDELDQSMLVKKALKSDLKKLKWKAGISKSQKEKATRLAFDRLSYDERLNHCLRPEEVYLKEKEHWLEINEHLGTNATSLQELVQQLGLGRFGRNAIVGDAFAGGGSIPFEAARMGCDAFASDLNPVAGLLTWADLNIAGASDETIKELRAFQQHVYDAVDKQVQEWGIETNEEGHRANSYLYCVETDCPECGYILPLSPSWVIGKGSMTIAVLKDNNKNGFDIEIKSGVTPEELSRADDLATVRNGSTLCPHCKKGVPITVLRKDRKNDNGITISGLRQWKKSDFIPSQNDIFRERLYCIRYEYEERRRAGNGEEKTKTVRYYKAPTKADHDREQKVISILSERFNEWQVRGFIPNQQIEDGDKTSELIRTRGWNYWHQLFNPRQLLVHGLFIEKALSLNPSKIELVLATLGLNKLATWNSKLSPWDSLGTSEKGSSTFYNQALNPIFNGLARTISTLDTTWFFNINNYLSNGLKSVILSDARNIDVKCHYWITDPPYADAVNYHELSEFFLAWDKELLKKAFPEWYTDSKRILAVKGTGQYFNQSMIEVYRNLNNHMPDNGMQVVMFTHQSPAVWADLTMILWSAGLHVTAAWNIATETDAGGLKEGNYVKGTVLLVLRKRTTSATAFTDEITFEIQEEVRHQIDSMRTLEDKEDPNFSDADYLLAAYAATLKVLTSYEKIGDINIEYELSKPRDGKAIGSVEAIINNAIRVAYDYLIPQSFDSYIWKNLTPEERFFIKGMELEKSNVYQLGAYQEMARGFGVKEFKDMLASTKANQVRFKTPTEFGNRSLGNSDGFSNTLLRQVLMAIGQSEKEQNGQVGRAWLKNEVDDYWNMRTTIIELLKYLTSTEYFDHMAHWQNPATYAKYLVELVSNDGV
jgi:adenine-specific DNA methylase